MHQNILSTLGNGTRPLLLITGFPHELNHFWPLSVHVPNVLHYSLYTDISNSCLCMVRLIYNSQIQILTFVFERQKR
jgi:hypothetical protein